MSETKPLSDTTGSPAAPGSTEALAAELAQAKRQIAYLTEEMAPNLRNLAAAYLQYETDQKTLSDHLVALTQECDGLRQEVEAMRRSRFWRQTRPVRALSRLIKRLRF